MTFSCVNSGGGNNLNCPAGRFTCPVFSGIVQKPTCCNVGQTCGPVTLGDGSTAYACCMPGNSQTSNPPSCSGDGPACTDGGKGADGEGGCGFRAIIYWEELGL